MLSHYHAGNLAAAEDLARVLTVKYPDDVFGWKALGPLLALRGKQEESLVPMREAIRIAPNDAEAHYNLGNLLKGLGRLNEAEVAFREAVRLNPGHAETHYNLGVTLKALGRLADAEAVYRDTIRLKPDFAEAHSNLGNILSDLGRLVDAEAAYREALRLKPDSLEVCSNLLFCLNRNVNFLADEALLEARRFGALLSAQARPKFSDWQTSGQSHRLRVGFVSGDLRNHPVGYFLEGVLQQLDREQFELIAFPTTPMADAVTARIRPNFDRWMPIYGKNDLEAATHIHQQGIHILFDLSGITFLNRLPVFAYRPAPVQVSWLGYFATTGVAEMDYLLADPVSVPPALECQFTEKIWHLPDTRLCFTPPFAAAERALAVSRLPAQRNGHVTWGCYQLLAKTNTAVFRLWAQVLQRQPTSVLRWQARQFADPALQAVVLGRMQDAGIPVERVRLLGPNARQAYLESYAEVDAILDTFPFTGGTTTCEALWMGVPTLTLLGNTLIGRQGASLLTAAGLSEWVAETQDDYVAKAQTLTSDINRLATLRAGLREQVMHSPVFDAARFARNLETALWGMWAQQRGSGRGNGK